MTVTEHHLRSYLENHTFSVFSFVMLFLNFLSLGALFLPLVNRKSTFHLVFYILHCYFHTECWSSFFKPHNFSTIFLFPSENLSDQWLDVIIKTTLWSTVLFWSLSFPFLKKQREASSVCILWTLRGWEYWVLSEISRKKPAICYHVFDDMKI